MAKDIIGIDISDASIEAIVLNKKGGNFIVDTYSRFRLSPEIIVDGKILKPDKLKEALQLVFKSAQPRAMDPAKVYLSVSESKVFTKVFNFPKNLNEKELKEAAIHRAEEMIPEDTTQLFNASQLLPNKNEHKEVLYVTAEKEAVLALTKIFQEQNIEVLGVTTESFSAYYGLNEKFKKNQTLLLDIGSHTTIAAIYDSNGVRDSININIAGFNIIEAMIKRFSIDYLKAEELIRDVGLTAEPGDGEVMLLIQGQLQPLLDEVNRFVSYFQESNQGHLEQVVLIGGLAQMRGIVNYFGANLNLPTFIGETFLSNNNSEAVAFTKYINALGLARLCFEKNNINFFDSIDKKTLKQELIKDEKLIAPKQDTEATEIPAAPLGLAKYKLLFKKIFGSLFFALFLMLIGLGGSFIFLRKPLQNLFVRETSFSVNAEKITVGLKSPGGANQRFVYGQDASFVLNQEKDYPGLSYEEVKDKIVNNLSEEVLNELNKKYQQTGYYIIPQIIGTQIIDMSPKQADFKVSQPVKVQVKFSFVAIANNDVKQVLGRIAKATEQTKILSSEVEQAEYKLISWDSTSQLFVLEVNFKFKTK